MAGTILRWLMIAMPTGSVPWTPMHCYLSSNNVITIITENLARRVIIVKGVVRSTSTIHVVNAIANKYGLRIYEVPIGFKHSVKYLLRVYAEAMAEEKLDGIVDDVLSIIKSLG